MTAWLFRFLLLSSLVIPLHSCSEDSDPDPKPSPQTQTSKKEVELPISRDPKTFACTETADCVRVKSDCCGCSSGGKDTAINKEVEEEWKTEHKCYVICTAVISDDPSCSADIACADGKCTLD